MRHRLSVETEAPIRIYFNKLILNLMQKSPTLHLLLLLANHLQMALAVPRNQYHNISHFYNIYLQVYVKGAYLEKI